MDNNGEHRPTRTLSPLLRFLLKLKFWVVDHLRLSERQLTLIWAALIGILGALASESFRKASEFLHYVATGSSSGIISSFAKLPWWQRLTVPTVGGLASRTDPLVREPAIRQRPAKDDHRLHGSDRGRQRYHFCPGKSRQKRISSLFD